MLNIDKNGNYEILDLNITKINIEKKINAVITLNVMNELKNIKLDITVDEGAEIDFIIFDEGKNNKIKINIDVESNATFNVKGFIFAKEINSYKIDINLNGETASSDFKLITIASNDTDNKFDVKLINNNIKTNANIWQKGVVINGGKNAFVATGQIKKGCDDAKNFQESRVLLLDGACVGDASPILLIDHYNVEAGHAASVSRVNSEELYYLQTRGIAETIAQKIMTIAFVKPLIDEMNEEQQVVISDKINELLK